MKNHLVVAVGGTGQMVLHYYIQLYLLGVVEDPFHAVVIDTDDVMDSIESARAFFELLRYGDQKGVGLGATVPTIDVIPFHLTESVRNTRELLTGKAQWNNPDPHPASAFFSEDALDQNLMRGLFARPALSSVLSQDTLTQAQSLTPDHGSTTIVVGSVIGGTGGGLTAPVLDTVFRKAKDSGRSTKLRAVLFGEYFEADNTKLENAQARFQSNQNLVLQALENAHVQLHSFYIVGGPGTPLLKQRDQTTEMKGEHLPWPEKDNLHWEGLRALHYMRIESVRDAKDRFFQRLIEPEEMQESGLNYQKALRYRRVGLEHAHVLVNKKVVLRLAQEPWAAQVWGTGLIKLLAHFWQLAVPGQPKAQVRSFPARVQYMLRDHWRGTGENSLALSRLFPRVIGRSENRVKPANLAQVNWPDPTEENAGYDPNRFNDVDDAAKRAAACLLFWALRTGGREHG